jgi:predicted GTPase
MVLKNIRQFAPAADIVTADSPPKVDKPELIRNKRVLVVEDGPTITHGEMAFGAGTIAAKRFGAAEIVDPRPSASGSIKEVFQRYPHIGAVLPAVGYGAEQRKDLENTINRADCDLVLYATPIDLTRLISIDKPSLKVHYEYADHGEPRLQEVLVNRMIKRGILTSPSPSA